jgi:Toxin PAAR-like domain/GHH signature containing HNH/Endo VII superfamily nuclease toxin  2
MANQVYANNMEICCKSASGKSICAMPDVCFTPPVTPPPGIPIPYPNTGMASDSTSGSTTVQISGQEVMLKDKSYFKQSTGDEAGNAPKKGVITSKIQGKVYFNSWSMDVKVEGENVVRHLDLTTHNHASKPGNTPPWPYTDQMAVALDHPCVPEMKREYSKCKEFAPYKKGAKSPCPPDPPAKPSSHVAAMAYAKTIVEDRNGAGACMQARRCMLQPYKKSVKNKGGCCNGQTGHHLIEASAFYTVGRNAKEGVPLKNCEEYAEGDAPSICLEGTNHGAGTHGLMHMIQSANALKKGAGILPTSAGRTISAEHVTTVGEAETDGSDTVSNALGCDPKCIEAQLKDYHERKCGIPSSTKIKAVNTCKPDEAKAKAAEASMQALAPQTVVGAAL